MNTAGKLDSQVDFLRRASNERQRSNIAKILECLLVADIGNLSQLLICGTYFCCRLWDKIECISTSKRFLDNSKRNLVTEYKLMQFVTQMAFLAQLYRIYN